jgi:hypothetical protein
MSIRFKKLELFAENYRVPQRAHFATNGRGYYVAWVRLFGRNVGLGVWL